MRKGVRRMVIILSVVLLLVVIAGVVVGNMLYELALNPNSDKGMVLQAPHNQIVVGESVGMAERTGDAAAQRVEQWRAKVDSRDAYITSRDGLQLHAYVEEPATDGHSWVIFCHGYGGQAVHLFRSAIPFFEQGFRVLLPDARGAGQSEGHYIGMGWHERLDIVDWINEIIAWDPQAEIALYGVSMGGATVMMTSGEALPENVKVIVEDCGYTSVWDEFAYQLKQLFNLPTFPVLNFASLVTRVRAGFWFDEADAVSQVAKSVTPMMFIHGDSDTFVPSDMVYKVYEAANCAKELLVVEGAGHGMAAGVMGAPYWASVFEFMGRYMTIPGLVTVE